MPGTTLARGNILSCELFAASLTPAQVAQNTSAEQSFTVLGVGSVNEYINCQSVQAQTAGIFIANCRVSAPNTVAITFANITGSPATPVSGIYGFIWGKPENVPLPGSPV